MGKLDHNLDAYRLAAAALERLRALIRRHLQAAHGPDWETTALPDDPAQFLAQRRARESSVKWNPSSAIDLLDFAGFCNLHEILNTNTRLREGFARLVPEPQALRLRFLELDTVLNRIAYARPVSDSDMELLLGFDERLRQLVNDLAPDADVPAGDSAAPAPRGEGRRSTRQAESREAPAPAAEPPRPARPPAAPAAQPVPQPVPQPAPPPPPLSAAAPGEPPALQRQPEPVPAPSRERQDRARAAAPAGGATRQTTPAPPRPAEDLPETAPRELETALRRGDDRAVLTGLYQEITALAERLWSDSATVRAPMWEMVSESPWYRERFSGLRLRVVSNFYDLLRAVQERRASGSSRNELHEFLKERNFAQVLMDLREFFRPYVAPPRSGQAE